MNDRAASARERQLQEATQARAPLPVLDLLRALLEFPSYAAFLRPQLASDRTSCCSALANQVRLVFRRLLAPPHRPRKVEKWRQSLDRSAPLGNCAARPTSSRRSAAILRKYA